VPVRNDSKIVLLDDLGISGWLQGPLPLEASKRLQPIIFGYKSAQVNQNDYARWHLHNFDYETTKTLQIPALGR
jgi:hypothetical protein